MNENYLAHHGIKGQRWGVEHGPPYPVKRGFGGKPKITNVVKSRLKASMEKRKAAKAEKKEETAAEKHEQLRREVVKNPKKIYKNKDMFSKEELDSIIKEIEFNRKIEDVRLAEIARGQKKLESFQSTLSTTAKTMNNIKSIYNLAAEFNNMMVDSGKSNGKKWTLIGGKDGDSNSGSDKKGAPKVDTTKKMSDPAVSKPEPKTTAAVDRTIKRYGTNAMSSVDRAMSFTTFNGPLGFYNSNPEVYTRFLNR